ncbi:hypothetical protein ACV229_27005 [Burkholderia sp. MR1-5-21]
MDRKLMDEGKWIRREVLGSEYMDKAQPTSTTSAARSRHWSANIKPERVH